MHEELEPGRNHIAVDVLTFSVRDGGLLLTLSRRRNPPHAGCWALPGRLVGVEESAESAVEALLKELLPVEKPYMEQLYTFTAPNRDPRGRVISVAYLLLLPWERLQAALAQEGSGASCFRVDSTESALRLTAEDGTVLTGSELAFDHGEIVRTGVARLRGKMDYTEVGFRFLRDTSAFSLGELQSVFEAVLGKAVDSSNFRRWVRSRYEETGRMERIAQAKQQGRGRPSALYRLTRTEGGAQA